MVLTVGGFVVESVWCRELLMDGVVIRKMLEKQVGYGERTRKKL